MASQTSNSRKRQVIGVYDGFKVLKLKYGECDNTRIFSMYLFLPDAKDGLPLLVDKLSSEPGFVNSHLPSSPVYVGKFLVPKFKISFDFEASDFLQGLGLVLPHMTEIVEGETGEDDLIVNEIYHKSFIEVNEEGTEAAAVTTALISRSSLRSPPTIDFVADHPFLFLIREYKTGVVMFVGTLLNPSVSSS